MHKKASFDKWGLVIDTLETWGVFRHEVAEQYRALSELRNRSIHFRPETDTDDRGLALSAIQALSHIVQLQFGAIGTLPWFIPGASGGACFIRKDCENSPFIRLVYLPNCELVGPHHTLVGQEGNAWIAKDDHTYEDRTLSDTEFIQMYNADKG